MQPENLFCVAVKHAKRLKKRINKKPGDDSDSEEDDLVRTFNQSVIRKLSLIVIAKEIFRT